MSELETLQDLFTHPGWKIVSSLAEEATEAFRESLEHAETVEELFKLKGQLQQMRWFLALPDVVRLELDGEDEGL